MSNKQHFLPRALPISDAAKYMGVHRTTIYRLAHAGHLNIRKIGSRTILLREEIDHYLSKLPISVGPNSGTQ